MTMLEDQIAALLKAAPGEPPVSIDPDVLLDPQPRQRGRLLAPLLVAATVAAVAIGVAVATHHKPTPPPARTLIYGGKAPDPHVVAIARVNALLEHAAVPPGAVAGHRHIHVDDSFSSVRGSETWTTAESIRRVRTYLRAHPPVGLTRRPHDSTILYYSSNGDTRSLQYEFTASASVVTIHVYAWAVWTPIRPAWSYLRGTVTSIDVTLVRKSRIPDQGAPTVRKTLTGDAVRKLAELLNSLPAQRPALCHSAGPWEDHTKLLFHTDRRPLSVSMAGNCMNQAGIGTRGNRHDFTQVAGEGLVNAALHALGLPKNYGYGPR